MEIPKNAYACANCHQRFNNPTILIKHVELRHSVAKKSQNCVRPTEPEEINASIENKDPLENTSPSIVPFEFSCSIGNNMEVDPQEIEVPIKDKHEEINNQEFKSEKNKQNDDMEKYTTSIHEGKKVFKCNMCDKNSIWKHAMKQHMASVHEGKKPFKCEVCDYSCSQNSSLKRHAASVHEGMKPFKCAICDYSCSRKVYLKAHVASVHEGKKPFKCEVCDFSCSQKHKLKQHLESVHENKNILNQFMR